jgi:hypothetical protein
MSTRMSTRNRIRYEKMRRVAESYRGLRCGLETVKYFGRFNFCISQSLSLTPRNTNLWFV